MTRGLRHWVYRPLSYFWPVTVKTARSEISGQIQVRMLNGKLLLDTAHANYSFGSLHRLFRKVFRHLEFPNAAPSSMLLLGLGGGSIVSIIREEYGLGLPITAVDADPVVINLAAEMFGIGRFVGVEVLCADAADFVRDSDREFGMIVADLFVDNDVPEKFTTLPFLSACHRLLAPGGRAIVNFIVGNTTQESRYRSLLANAAEAGFRCEERTVFGTNRVVFMTRA